MPLNPFARIAALLAVLVALSGCSSLQVAYSFADDVLEGRAADMLDLDREERAGLARQTEAMIDWHRAEMLPRYARFLNQQADMAEAGGWTPLELSRSFEAFRALADQTVEGAAPFVAEILIEHTAPEKLQYLEDRMADYLEERFEEERAETADDSIAEWVDRRVDRFERFVGDLTDDQKAIIRRYTEDGMDDGLRWLEHSQHRNAALIDFLSSQPSEAALTQFVYRLIIQGPEVADPAYRAIQDRRWQLREAMYFEVLDSLSSDQRETLITSLRDYADQMMGIAGV